MCIIDTLIKSDAVEPLLTTCSVDVDFSVENSVETWSGPEEIVENYVNDVNNSVSTMVHSEPTYTEEELEILTVIIYQEAGGDACSDDTRRKVGSVVINRVNSDLFPNTFWEVATGKNQYGFSPETGVTWPARAVYKQEAHAIERAYKIAEELLVGGSILPDNVIWQAGFTQGDGIYCHQDGIYFCYSEVIK